MGNRNRLKTRRYKRRPIPRSLGEFTREVEGIHSFLDKLAEMKDPSNQKWRDNMTAYYRARLEELKRNKPKEVRRIEGGRVILRRRSPAFRHAR